MAGHFPDSEEGERREMKWLYAARPTKAGLYLRTTRYGYAPVRVVEEGGELWCGAERLLLSEISAHVSWLGPLPEADSEAWSGFVPDEVPQGRKNQRLALIAGALVDFVSFLKEKGFSLQDLLEEFAGLRELDLQTAQPKWYTFAQTRYQLRMRAQGKCLICGAPAVNKRHCEHHREERRLKQNERRAHLREQGIKQKRYGR
jgi:hypothetical protein